MAHLNYKELGEGEPVIILHGLLGMLDNWKSFAKKLAENYWVIIVDQRNHGKSFHSDEFNYQELASDLRKLMTELYIPKAHFIGHSMGGKTVMQFMIEHTDMVDKAIIVDISPTGSIGNHNNIFESLLNANVQNAGDRSEIANHLLTSGLEQSTASFLMKNLSRNKEKGGFRWKANVSVLYKEYQNILAEITSSSPVEGDILFIGGGLSNYIKDTDLPIIKELFPDYKYRVIEDAGHWVHADKMYELLDLTKMFLSEI